MARLALLVLCVYVGLAAAAEPPAGSTPSLGAPALGTLFHSAEERARLDRIRRGESEPAAAPAPGQASAVTGFVKRSDGRNTVWIDGTAVSVRGNQAAEVFDPRAVRAYTDRQDDSVRIQRRNTP